MIEENELTNLYFDELPNAIKKRLVEVDYYSEEWMNIFKNKETGQLWAIDIYDKYQPQIAVKIDSLEQLKNINFKDIRKNLLFKSRGGCDESTCIMKGCNKKRVKGVVYCIDHLYETGARK